MWHAKLAVCVVYDLFDLTLGRALFLLPFSGELVGCVLCAAMFGKAGMLYGLEAIDFTEVVDGFIPTATIIACMNRPTVSNG